jgi:hypothetical protein
LCESLGPLWHGGTRIQTQWESTVEEVLQAPLSDSRPASSIPLAVICLLGARQRAQDMPSQTASAPASRSFRLRRRDLATFSIFAKTTCLFLRGDIDAYPPTSMASLSRSTLLPQCTSCIRRFTRQNIDVWGPQQTRSISKKAKEAERNIIVKLLKDMPRYGRAGVWLGDNLTGFADASQARMCL